MSTDTTIDIMTAHGRLTGLLDEGSFEVIDTEGVVTGRGLIDERPVYVYAQEPSVNAGAMTEDMAKKICKVMDMSLDEGVPLISLNECAGAHIKEGTRSLAGFADIFRRNVQASGVVPQISAIYGPCAGGAVYSPALTDFTVMLKDSSYMFVTGPGVVKSVIGEEVSKEELGGASVHSFKSGVAHFAVEDEAESIHLIRELMGFLPSNNREEPPVGRCSDPPERTEPYLNQIVPENPRKPYDMYSVIKSIADDGYFLEVHRNWARNVIVALARMGGAPVGIVASQPKVLAGVLDGDASRKAARFVRFCDAFNIPIVTLVDVPGFLCGTQQEYGGVITHGAKLIYAYAEATVPKVTVVLRKAYGGAYVSMGCKQLGCDVNLAWPSAKIAVMGAESAVEVLHRSDPEFMEDYNLNICSPHLSLDSGSLDEIIEPSNTRGSIIRALKQIKDIKTSIPWKKHDNMPL